MRPNQINPQFKKKILVWYTFNMFEVLIFFEIMIGLTMATDKYFIEPRSEKRHLRREKFCGKLCWKNGCKSWAGNLVERSGWNMFLKTVWKKWLAILGWKFDGQIWRESFVEQLYGTVELTIVWKKLYSFLVDKFNGIFPRTVRRRNVVK